MVGVYPAPLTASTEPSEADPTTSLLLIVSVATGGVIVTLLLCLVMIPLCLGLIWCQRNRRDKDKVQVRESKCLRRMISLLYQ